MPLSEAVDLINHALEEEQQEKSFRIWLARYPNYTKDNFETFGEFYDKTKPQKVQYDMRSKDVIMNDILKIERKEE